MGYEVHLVDATPRLADVARQHDAGAAHRLASIAVGDARHLPFENASVDVVLLLGPLYHLTEQTERRAALQEALRILRAQGAVMAAGISRYASVLDGLAFHPGLDTALVAMRHRVVADGQYRNHTGDPRFFVTAYFHQPQELGAELSDVGVDAVRVFGIEGPGWLLRDFESRWKEVELREEILNVARLLEEEPCMIGASAHLLAVGRKQ
jgi:SAM-dependent methyltransferase